MAIQREIAHECLKSAQKCWKEKDGTEADMAFVGQQLVMHQKMIDAGTVLQRHVSSELSDLIDQGVSTAKEHKELAESLIEELAHEKQESRSDS